MSTKRQRENIDYSVLAKRGRRVAKLGKRTHVDTIDNANVNTNTHLSQSPDDDNDGATSVASMMNKKQERNIIRIPREYLTKSQNINLLDDDLAEQFAEFNISSSETEFDKLATEAHTQVIFALYEMQISRLREIVVAQSEHKTDEKTTTPTYIN